MRAAVAALASQSHARRVRELPPSSQGVATGRITQCPQHPLDPLPPRATHRDGSIDCPGSTASLCAAAAGIRSGGSRWSREGHCSAKVAPSSSRSSRQEENAQAAVPVALGTHQRALRALLRMGAAQPRRRPHQASASPHTGRPTSRHLPAPAAPPHTQAATHAGLSTRRPACGCASRLRHAMRSWGAQAAGDAESGHGSALSRKKRRLRRRRAARWPHAEIHAGKGCPGTQRGGGGSAPASSRPTLRRSPRQQRRTTTRTRGRGGGGGGLFTPRCRSAHPPADPMRGPRSPRCPRQFRARFAAALSPLNAPSRPAH
jgi:hypothetical protein